MRAEVAPKQPHPGPAARGGAVPWAPAGPAHQLRVVGRAAPAAHRLFPQLLSPADSSITASHMVGVAPALLCVTLALAAVYAVLRRWPRRGPPLLLAPLTMATLAGTEGERLDKTPETEQDAAPDEPQSAPAAIGWQPPGPAASPAEAEAEAEAEKGSASPGTAEDAEAAGWEGQGEEEWAGEWTAEEWAEWEHTQRQQRKARWGGEGAKASPAAAGAGHLGQFRAPQRSEGEEGGGAAGEQGGFDEEEDYDEEEEDYDEEEEYGEEEDFDVYDDNDDDEDLDAEDIAAELLGYKTKKKKKKDAEELPPQTTQDEAAITRSPQEERWLAREERIKGLKKVRTAHLGGSLGVYRVSEEEQEDWEKIANRFPRKWTHPAPFLHKRYSFEFDGLKEIHKRSFQYHVLLEIRDVRVPDSSHHPSFQRLARHRLHLIYYTHADLIDKPTRDRVKKWTLESWPKAKCVFLDTHEGRSGGFAPFEGAYELLMDSIESKSNNCALTVGMPNVGKSSVLFNLLRGSGRRLRAKPEVKDIPGFTKKVTEYLLRAKPKAICIDVPGITPPPDFLMERPQSWYGLVACNLLALPKEVDPEVTRMVCKYILYCCNREKNFMYVKQLKLDGPTDDIDRCLDRVRAPYIFIKLFQKGSFGSVILDDLRYLHRDFEFRDWDPEERQGQFQVRHWGMEDEMSESEWSQWLADGEPRRESWGGGKYGGGKYGGGKYGGGKNGGFGGKNGGFKGGGFKGKGGGKGFKGGFKGGQKGGGRGRGGGGSGWRNDDDDDDGEWGGGGGGRRGGGRDREAAAPVSGDDAWWK